MLNNKYITKNNSTLLFNKINELANQLKLDSQNKSLQTREQLATKANSLLSTFFSNISSPLFNPIVVKRGTKPDWDQHKNNFNSINNDLNIIFSELENLETILISNFDFMISDTTRLTGKLKSVFSKLGDYILYSNEPSKDFIFNTDSFNNLDRIDFNSKLLNSSQAEIDQVQGIVTLPINQAASLPIKITIPPIINSNSNGEAGDNWTGGPLNNDIKVILDNNPDTWFEYEKVFNNLDDITEPLVLDITINIDDPKVVNYIRINPNNFGTKLPVQIETIETSLDGKHYISIKDDIPLPGFITQDEDNVFLLAPSTSKFAGQGIYTFTPRKIKYIHIVFKQSSPYSILAKPLKNVNIATDSALVNKIRLAIGIRDIEIVGHTYESEGEIISNIYDFTDEVSKLILITNQNPIAESELVSIDHFISPDDGITWYPIIPKDFDTNDIKIPKILNFNTLDTNSINTKTPVKSLRYKAVLNRSSTSIFNSNTSALKKIVKSAMEFHVIPQQTPFAFPLNNIPIPDTIKVLDPLFGMRGGENDRTFDMARGNSSTLFMYLPFTHIKKDYIKVFNTVWYLSELDPEQIMVGGELWTRGDLSSASSTDKIYSLDYVTGKLQFGDGVTGLAPPVDSKITMRFKPERLFPTADDNHLITLDYPMSNDKKLITIKQIGETTVNTEVLINGANVHHLQRNNLLTPVKFSDLTVFGTEKAFINGVSELVFSGDYSIDYTNGTIYSYLRTVSTADTTITYNYQPIKILNENEYEFISSSTKSILSINNDSFTTYSIKGESIPVSVNYFNLSKLAIVKDTLTFTGDEGNSFKQEVAFINGKTELSNVIKVTDQLSVLGGSGIKTINLRMIIIDSTDYKVNFSNTTVFATEVSTEEALNAPGKYLIDRTNSLVKVYISSTIDAPGSIQYYYSNGSRVVDGLYSVNYKTGEVFCTSSTAGTIIADYKYSNYVADYYISRQIPKSDFSLDINTNVLTIHEREIFQRLKSNSSTLYYQIIFDQVVENRENINELEPYFTPILKDYALKVLSKNIFNTNILDLVPKFSETNPTNIGLIDSETT